MSKNSGLDRYFLLYTDFQVKNSSVKLALSSNNELSSRTTLVLIGLAIILSMLNIWDAFPLFADTSTVADSGIILKADYNNLPFGIFTYTYCTWWRPIGFGLPILINWLFHPPTFIFYVMGLFVHFGVGFFIWWFAKRLFSSQIAWFSYIFYMLSVSGLALTGYPLNAFQDGLFSCLLLLAWGLMFPKSGKQVDEKRVYWSSGILFLLAALCKDSWMGAFPIMLATDWVVIRKSSLKERIRRLLPFLVVTPLPLLHYLAVDKTELSYIFSCYITIGFHPSNFLYGLLTSFLPFVSLLDFQRWHYLLVIIVLLILLVAFLSGYKRAKITLIAFMYGAILLILFSSFYKVYWAYVRIISPTVFSSILLALMFKAMLGLVRNEYLLSLILIAVVGSLYILTAANREGFTQFLLLVR